MLFGFLAFLLLVILPPPLPLLALCFVFAYFFVREACEGLGEFFGHDSGRAQRRHTERMQRMQHEHERWQARREDRVTRRADDHPRISRALQGRLARWIDNWGTSIQAIDDRNLADAQAGRTPGAWRVVWRRTRQRIGATVRGWATRAEERLDNRGRIVELTPAAPNPAAPTTAADIDIDIDTVEIDPADTQTPITDDVVHDTPVADPEWVDKLGWMAWHSPAGDARVKHGLCAWGSAGNPFCPRNHAPGSPFCVDHTRRYVTQVRPRRGEDPILDCLIDIAQTAQAADIAAATHPWSDKPSHLGLNAGDCAASPNRRHDVRTIETTQGTRTGCVWCHDGFRGARLVDPASHRALCPVPVRHAHQLRPCHSPIDPNSLNQNDCGLHGSPVLAVHTEQQTPEPPTAPAADMPAGDEDRAGRPHLSVVPDQPAQDAPAATPGEPRNTQGDHTTMSEETINLASGQTINPEAGIQFADSVGDVVGEVATRVQNSIAALQQAGVDEGQIAEMQELANHLTAANSRAAAMSSAFTGHQEARGAVESAGAGTENGYLTRP